MGGKTEERQHNVIVAHPNNGIRESLVEELEGNERFLAHGAKTGYDILLKLTELAHVGEKLDALAVAYEIPANSDIESMTAPELCLVLHGRHDALTNYERYVGLERAGGEAFAEFWRQARINGVEKGSIEHKIIFLLFDVFSRSLPICHDVLHFYDKNPSTCIYLLEDSEQVTDGTPTIMMPKYQEGTLIKKLEESGLN